MPDHYKPGHAPWSNYQGQHAARLSVGECVGRPQHIAEPSPVTRPATRSVTLLPTLAYLRLLDVEMRRLRRSVAEAEAAAEFDRLAGASS